MTDFICRKSMMRCQTPGTCSPHGGCQASTLIETAAVLDMVSKIEGLLAQHGRDSKELRDLCQARDEARKERDQLKAEVEALRKDAERYRYMRNCSCEFRSSLPNHDPVSHAEYDAECDAAMSKEAGQ